MINAHERQRVARRALVLGAISFRASLEVTDDPRAVGISKQILPRLREVGCEAAIDPIEADLLATPLGYLGPSLRLDANCAGEAAAFFCWTLELAEPVKLSEPADSSEFPLILSVLRPEAAEIIRSAKLRDLGEITDACRDFVLIRSMLQESRVGEPASGIIRRFHLRSLEEAGIAVSDEQANCISEIVARMTSEERARAAGLSFVRSHAALWLFSDRIRYFEE